MRLLYSFPHPVGRPGIGTTALNQVRSLARSGAEVTLVCTSLHDDVPAGVEVRETLVVAGRRVPHRALGSPDRALAYHDLRAARLLDGRRAWDVVHVWPGAALRTIGRAAERGTLSSREVPNTHTEHAYEVAAAEAAAVGVEPPRGHSHRPDARRLDVERREYAAADLLMVPSPAVAQTFLDRHFPESRLGRHRYGYDPVRFHPRGRDDVPRPFTAVVLGSAEPRKGLHHALDAWRRADLPAGSRLLIAGGFVDGYADRLRADLAQPGVEALGFVDDVGALLRECDVLVMPSVEEGSALVTYEAQACGCVPLASTAAGAHLPPDLEAWTHDPRDTATLAGQLERVAADPALLARLREAVLAWAPGLTWDAAGARMLEIYDDRLTGRSA